jgi:hypothetical protein
VISDKQATGNKRKSIFKASSVIEAVLRRQTLHIYKALEMLIRNQPLPSFAARFRLRFGGSNTYLK